MRIAIVTVPYISNDLHLRFMLETMGSVRTMHDIYQIGIINHAREQGQEHKYFNEIYDHFEYNKRNNLSMAWNRGIYKAMEEKADYILVPNLDIIFHPKCIDNLVKFAQEHKEALVWTGNEFPDKEKLNDSSLTQNFDEHPHFSCFMVNKETIETVGWFDEIYDCAYNEDNDYAYRLRSLGKKALKTDSARFFHYGSRTIKSDYELEIQNIRTHGANNHRYIIKWGGMPDKETYRYPYNDPNISFKSTQQCPIKKSGN